jgi:hypothetical protein
VHKIAESPLLLGISILALLSCAHRPDMAGTWREVGKSSILEFRRDGTFKAVDDIGMTASGQYALNADRSIRFDIRHEDSPTETIEG